MPGSVLSGKFLSLPTLDSNCERAKCVVPNSLECEVSCQLDPRF